MCSFQSLEMHDVPSLKEQGRSEESARAPHPEHPTAPSLEDVRITAGNHLNSPPNSFSSTVSPVEREGLGSLTCVAPSLNIAPPVDHVPPKRGVGQMKVEGSGSQTSQPASGLSAKVTGE